MKKVTISFYGASVTQQAINQNGEMVGYVPHTKKILEEKHPEYELVFHQLGFGSNHLDDAGYLYFSKLIATSPDIVFLEWHTTGLAKFDSAKYDYIIDKLLEKNCVVVNLILPFKRCIGKSERENIKQSRWYQEKNVRQINFYKLLDEQEIDKCLRDEVHTNQYGGLVYGKIISKVIEDILQGKQIDKDSGETIVPEKSFLEAPKVSSFSLQRDLQDDETMLITYNPTAHEVRFFCESTLGPFSPILDVRYQNKSETIMLIDQWCGYERKCLKPISPAIGGDVSTVSFSISRNNPIEREDFQHLADKNPTDLRKMKNIEKIYCQGGEILNIEITKLKTKVFIFANCHGMIYKKLLEAADPMKVLEIEHVISYENMNNFENMKPKFAECDILIIQPVQNYEQFKIENIKPLLKKECQLIRVPFIRFNGLWDKEDVRVLKKFTEPAVMFFPKIFELNEIDAYLKGTNSRANEIVENFEKAVEELRVLEKQGDVQFADFIATNCKKIPLFRDPYHPTTAMYDFIAYQILKKVSATISDLQFNDFALSEKILREPGHFKPIRDDVASVLGIKYDLDSYFVFSRKDYLNAVLSYENSNVSEKITTYADFDKLVREYQQKINLVEVENIPKIYIVTPSFNSADTISRTIESVIEQAGNFEIFYHIQDGGSADSTLNIIKEYMNKIENNIIPILCSKINISYESTRDTGMYDAIVKGFNTFGNIQDDSWLAWINSDDYYEKDAFKKIVMISDQHKHVNWISGRTCVLHTSGKKEVVEYDLDNTLCLKFGLADGVHWRYLQQEGTFFKFKLWNSLDKIRDFKSLKYAGDWNLWRKFAQKDELFTINEVLGVFCKREGQLSQIMLNEYLEEINSLVDYKEREQKFEELKSSNLTSNLLTLKDSKYLIETKKLQGHYQYRMNLFLERKKIEKELIKHDCFIAYDKDWQYPAITEQYAFEKIKQMSYIENTFIYLAFPWATLIDLLQTKKSGSNYLLKVLKEIKKSLVGKKRVVTVCQHILMLRFQNIFAELGITDVFWTHAIKNQRYFPEYESINIYPFPLYPVQAVDETVNQEKKLYLFSFIGARANQYYLTESRNYIIDFLTGDKRGLVIGRDTWHYNKVVYEHQIKKTTDSKEELIDTKASTEFKDIVQKSVFSLCPSGTGPNSIRLWESIGFGAIPVILADTYMPPGNQALWEEAAVFCEETEEAIKALPDRLEKIAQNPELLERKRHAMKQLWMLYGPDCFVYDIQALFLQLGTDSLSVTKKEDNFEKIIHLLLQEKTPSAELVKLCMNGFILRALSNSKAFQDVYINNAQYNKALKLVIEKSSHEQVSRFKKILQNRNISL